MTGDFGLDQVVQLDNRKPSNLEAAYYLFWEKGIDLNRFNQLPISYILGILRTHSWVKSEEERAHKKAGKK